MLVVGTGTEVGKTWTSCAVLTELRAGGLTVAARKPAQSHDPADGAPLDAALLSAATGEDPDTICPPGRTYTVPMAPPMAAAALSLPVPSLAELLNEITWSAGTDVGLVETAGGVRSPMASDGDGRDLSLRLRPDVMLLVADAGLGVIHAVRSAAEGLEAPVLVFLNRFDPGDELHQRNLAWLRENDGMAVEVDIAGLVRRFQPAPGESTGRPGGRKSGPRGRH